VAKTSRWLKRGNHNFNGEDKDQARKMKKNKNCLTKKGLFGHMSLMIEDNENKNKDKSS
jgi:hypothetical protein